MRVRCERSRRMVSATMGRPKKKRTGTGGPPRVKRIAIQATESWVEWVEGGARHCLTDVSKLVDAALVEYLRARGYEKPRPDRT